MMEMQVDMRLLHFASSKRMPFLAESQGSVSLSFRATCWRALTGSRSCCLKARDRALWPLKWPLREGLERKYTSHGWKPTDKKILSVESSGADSACFSAF